MTTNKQNSAIMGMCVLSGLLGACNQPPAVNPWREDSLPSSTWSTPSEQGILAANHQPVERHDGSPQKLAPTVSGQVPHYPLYFEDPFDDQGDRDGQFAWTWQDYLAMPYSFGRVLLNGIGFPVSVAVTPPGSSQVSDGKVNPSSKVVDFSSAYHPHDALPGKSPDPAGDRTDFNLPDSEPLPAETPSTQPQA